VFSTSRLASAQSTDPPGSVQTADAGAAVAGVAPARAPRRARRFPAWSRVLSLLVLVGLWQLASSTGLLPASKLA
jgi:hypothetical protein